MIPIVLLLVMSASLSSGKPVSIENIVDDVVARHMSEKQIPGMSVAVVHQQRLIFSRGYGLASVELDVKANADTVYPISSVSRTFAGVLAMRLVDAGFLNLDNSISDYLDGVPADKKAITVRHLLQHTHGLEDFYRSDAYANETGHPANDSSTQQLIDWSLHRPLQSQPGDDWRYGVVGYVILGQIFEKVGGASYASLVQKHVFGALDIDAKFGGSAAVVPGRNPMLYEWVVGHEGGGASWVIYYPDQDLAVIALSNMSGARADILPYEIARGSWSSDE